MPILPPGSGSFGAGLLGMMGMASGVPISSEDTTLAIGLTYYAMKQLLGQKLAYMNAWTIGLYKTSTAFNPTLTESAYTASAQVPSFQGYNPKSLGTWSAAYLDGSNNVLTNAPLVVWTPTGTSSPGPVAGFYVLDGGGNLVGAQENPSGPIIVGATLAPFAVAPMFQEQAIA